jgi:putative nucleotidyltransferase with HDIG domain
MNVGRHSLIFGLSYALDIAGKNNLSHSKSTAYIAVQIGRELGFSEEAELELYYSALLHDIGLGITYDMEQHCIDGERMLQNLPLPTDIARIVYCHHEYIDGSGQFGMTGDSVPLTAQIVGFASDFDDLFGKSVELFDSNLYSVVCEWLDRNAHLYRSEIREAFRQLIQREYFLLDYFNHETKYKISDKITVNDEVYYDYDDVVKYALCFADIIDRRSPFTYTHSHGIAGLAQKATASLGYDEITQNKMYIAGLLHDIGKLHVSIDILHKNGKLSPEERFEINKHTYFTRKILEQIEGFEDIVEYASNHHERLDGTGYPYRMPGERLSELERVMAVCDVYQALTEERPYRDRMPTEKAWGIIDEMAANKHLDTVLVEKLKRVFA